MTEPKQPFPLKYLIIRIPGHVIAVAHVGRGRYEALDPRHNLRNHSPDGYEFGYGGSGPAQLALAILSDHFRRGVTPGLSSGAALPAADEAALKRYQAFKRAFLAAPLARTVVVGSAGPMAVEQEMSRERAKSDEVVHFEITPAEIEAWLAAQADLEHVQAVASRAGITDAPEES